MRKRKIGNSDLMISPLVFGGNIFGWTVDQKTAFKLLDAFVASGCNLIDTADVYSRWAPGNKGGESETIIGDWLKHSSKRNQVIIATKVGMQMDEDKKGLSKKYIFQAVEDSLKRLQTDYIDLYQSHTDDSETPLEETLSAYKELIDKGKIRAIGASNYSATRLKEALEISKRHSYPRYQCVQPCYNLCERINYETNIEPLCTTENLGVITYYSLASGFLSGKYRSEEDSSKSVRGGRAQKYLNEKGLKILKVLDEVASEYSTKPATVALAWLIARPSVTAPISSATDLEQLESLIAATQLQLNEDAINLLNTASSY